MKKKDLEEIMNLSEKDFQNYWNTLSGGERIELYEDLNNEQASAKERALAETEHNLAEVEHILKLVKILEKDKRLDDK